MPPRAGLLAAALLLAPPALSGQQSTDDEAPFRAWALAEVTWKVTEVAGRGSSLLGGTVGFGLTPRTTIGGAGFRLAGSTSPDPGPDRGRRRLAFGYAGVVVEHLRFLDPDWAATGALLLGAGHGTVHDRDLALELGADTFGVVELRTGVLWSRPSPVHVFLGAGYRFVYGVQDLPGVSHADLRGPALTLGLRITGR